MRWKTAEIREIIEQALTSIPAPGLVCQIIVGECGGDYDSETIEVRFDDREFLHICGFHTQQTNHGGGNEPDDMEIEMIEVSDGQDSRGGLNSSHREMGISYGVICTTLRQKGFSVVPQLRDYF